MAPGIMNFLSFSSQNQTTPEAPSTVRALPSSWYTSQEMYELERRAIFSKKWMMITHQMRLKDPGDWLKFSVAGYEFIICRDRKDQINAFHNVCRHRAYPVVQGDKGTAKIFACKYHGWSYGLDGKLAKAPKYDELSGFDKSRNGMFPIHTKVDACGFVWVNLDSSSTPEPWEATFAGIDVQERYKQYNFDDYILDNEYSLTANCNWHLEVENFNDCYHCPTSHPDIPELADVDTHEVDADFAWIKHASKQTEEQKRKGMAIASTFFFPNVSISVLPHYIMLQRFLPTGSTSSVMHYQIFKNKNSSTENFQAIHQLYARVIGEDKVLCELVQKNLNAGIYVNGELHPRLEKGPLFFQKLTRQALRDHFEQEKKAKREIWPARQRLPDSATVSKEDEELCSGLSCQTTPAGMAW